ncbi:MAG: peptidase [Chloroflexota bacterium]
MPNGTFGNLCVDRVLEGAQLETARRLAEQERMDNSPLLPIGGCDPLVARPMAAVSPSPAEIVLGIGTLWRPGRVLRVRFLDGDPGLQARVEAVAHTWELYANILFDFGADPQAEIRISFRADPGSWSYVGTDNLGVDPALPTMNFGWLVPASPNDEVRRVVLHEFGHALGCFHEHQHPTAGIPWNRPAVYAAYAGPPNFWPPAKVDANVLNRYSETVTVYSGFDTASIMLYPIPRQLTDGVFEVGLNSDLSPVDRSYIGQVYPSAAGSLVQLVVDGAPQLAEIRRPGEEDDYCFQVATAGEYLLETTGSTDLKMGLYGPSDPLVQIAYNDDSGQGLNPLIRQSLQPGEYFLRVRHFRPRGTGRYRIVVRKIG